MSEYYTADIIDHKTANTGQISFGEMSELDVLRQLAEREEVEGETYIINRFKDGQCIRREAWSPAHVAEYLELIAQWAGTYSVFAPLPMLTDETDKG